MAPPMNAVSAWRGPLNTSGPVERSARRITVAAGRGFATIGSDGTAATGANSNCLAPSTADAKQITRHGHEPDDRGPAQGFCRDPEVPAEHVGLQARGGSPILDARGTDRIAAHTRRPRSGRSRTSAPPSTRIILEVLQTGSSPTIDAPRSPRAGTRTTWSSGATRRGSFSQPAQVLAALRNARLKGPRAGDYHGDLQMHIDLERWEPDAGNIVEGGLARGYTFCAVTDHFVRSEDRPRCVDGRPRAAASRHRSAEQEASRHVQADQRIEANIRADGSMTWSGGTGAARASGGRAALRAAVVGRDQTTRM